VKVRSITSSLVFDESREILGGDMSHDTDLYVQRGSLKYAKLISDRDGQLRRQFGVFEGCIANCVQGHALRI